MVTRKKIITSFIKEGKPYLILALNTLITSAFLVVFIFLNWGVDQTIKTFNLMGANKLALIIFQWLFTFSSIIFVGSYIFQSSIVAFIQAWRRIKQEFSLTVRQD